MSKRLRCYCRRFGFLRVHCIWNWCYVRGVLLRIMPGLVIGIFIVLYGLAFLVPQILGGAGLTVLTGSMSPTINPGDVVAVRTKDPETVCRDIATGDVITFMPYPDNPLLITHRVIARSAGNFAGWNCRFTTQGDANSAVDPVVLPYQIRGRVMYRVPWMGFVNQWVATHRGLLIIILASGAIISVAKYTQKRIDLSERP